MSDPFKGMRSRKPKHSSTPLKTTRQKIRFRRFSARRRWLAHRNRRETPFERLNHLAVATALKRLEKQSTRCLQMAAGKLDSQLRQVGITSRVRRPDSGEVGRHVGKQHVNLDVVQDAGELRLHRFIAKIALDDFDAGDRLHWKDIERNDSAAYLAVWSHQSFSHKLGPAAWRGAEVCLSHRSRRA